MTSFFIYNYNDSFGRRYNDSGYLEPTYTINQRKNGLCNTYIKKKKNISSQKIFTFLSYIHL